MYWKFYNYLNVACYWWDDDIYDVSVSFGWISSRVPAPLFLTLNGVLEWWKLFSQKSSLTLLAYMGWVVVVET